jgi:hypothetical protein
MKSLLGVLVAVVGVCFLSGCMMVYSPATGILLTEVYGPIDAGTKVGAKEGQACAESILGLVARGDASIKAAAKAGGITKIDSVDHYTRNFLGIIGEFCTIVRGS